MRILLVSISAMGVMTLSSCSKKTSAQFASGDNKSLVAERALPSLKTYENSPDFSRPPRIIYKMRGDYANLVPVMLDNMGELMSYPDPVDVTESQRPVPLGEGWYLDRRGIGENTAFLDYTYEEYHKLAKVPDQATLKTHIKVKNAISIIWNCGTQSRSIEEYKKLTKEGFPGCKCVFK